MTAQGDEGRFVCCTHRPFIGASMTQAHWMTVEEHGTAAMVKRAAVAGYDLSVMWLDGAAYWLVRRDGRDVAEGTASSLDRACIDAEREALTALHIRRSSDSTSSRAA